MLTKLLGLGVLALGGTAQDTPIEIKYNLTGFTYPRLAQSARIEGLVKLELSPSENGQEIKVLTGNKWFEQQARDNLAKWRTNQPVTVNYIFRLTDPDIVKVKVPRGDPFERIWLRL